MISIVIAIASVLVGLNVGAPSPEEKLAIQYHNARVGETLAIELYNKTVRDQEKINIELNKRKEEIHSKAEEARKLQDNINDALGFTETLK